MQLQLPFSDYVNMESFDQWQFQFKKNPLTSYHHIVSLYNQFRYLVSIYFVSWCLYQKRLSTTHGQKVVSEPKIDFIDDHFKNDFCPKSCA